jgi:large subunit ribosomal protein L9
MKGLVKMKVLLIKDVYKLGRAGEIKKVAAGYGRNYLIPQGFAIPATPGAMKQADRIKEKATERRAVLNQEMSSVAEVLDGKTLFFAVKAGETGRLYGSVNDHDIVDTVKENFEIELEKRQVETEPIRELGTYQVPVHLTMDLVPELKVIVYREGEAPGDETEEAEVEEDEVSAVEAEVPVVKEAVTEEEPEAEAEPEAEWVEEVESEPAEEETSEEDTEAEA